jgi:hypothetical protein
MTTNLSATLRSTGNITVTNGFTSSTAGATFTARADGDITVNATQRIQTNGGHVVLWSASDSSAGGVIRLLSGSEICTVSGTAGPSGTCSTITTGGGDIVLGGGGEDPNNLGRPGGYATGYGTDAAQNTGVQIGTILSTDAGARIYSAGGTISIKGRTTSTVTTYVHGVATLANSVVNSGSGSILIEGVGQFATTNVRPLAFSLSSTSGDTKIVSTSTSATAVVLRSYSTVDSNHGGLGFGGKVAIDLVGGLSIEADRIQNGM